MRGLVLFLLALIGVSLFSVMTTSVSNNKNEIKPPNIVFNTFTSAVCEDSSGFVRCRDVLFVNCNGNISKAADVIECNGIKLESSKVSGFAVFDKDWKDPRN